MSDDRSNRELTLAEQMQFITDYACTWGIEVNEHRVNYEPDEQNVGKRFWVQVYPWTPIGFFRVDSDDLTIAIREAYEELQHTLAESKEARPWKDRPR